MKPLIRKATAADADALLELVRDCVAGMRAAGVEQWDEVYPNADNIRRDIEAGTMDVLCEDGAVAGCVAVDRNMDPLWDGLDWSRDGEPPAGVHRLMVHPSRQGRGLAKTLMRHAETVAEQQGCRSIRLDTFLQNPAAMALYPRLGYRRTGTAMMRKGEFVGFEKLLHTAAGGIGGKTYMVRDMRTEDIPAAIALWQVTEGVGHSPDETPAMLTAFLDRNPGLSSATLDGEGNLIGAVLCGHDGRRGYLYHLAVDKLYRGSGLGRKLVQRSAEQLAKCGLVKATIMVYASNAEGQAFWRHLGWSARVDLEPMQINL